MAEQIEKPKRMWLLVILGILTIVCGIMMTVRPLAGLLWMSVMTGAFFIVDGLVEVFSWFRGRALLKTPVFVLIIAILSVVLGGLIIARPISGIGAIVMIASALFVISGISSIILAVNMNRALMSGWGWVLFSGILDIIIGLFMFGNPGFLAVFVGVSLVMRGAVFVVFGLQKNTLQVAE